MKFILEIDMTGASFEELDIANYEIRRILRKAETQVDATADILSTEAGRRLLDINGNTCGFWKVEDS